MKHRHPKKRLLEVVTNEKSSGAQPKRIKTDERPNPKLNRVTIQLGIQIMHMEEIDSILIFKSFN